MTFRFQPTLDDVREANEWPPRFRQWSFLVMLAITPLFLLASVEAALQRDGWGFESSTRLIVAAGLWASAFSRTKNFFRRSTGVRRYRELLQTRPGDIIYEADERGISAQWANSSFRVTWNCYSAIVQTKNLLLLVAESGGVDLIPKRAFETPLQMDEFLGLFSRGTDGSVHGASRGFEVLPAEPKAAK